MNKKDKKISEEARKYIKSNKKEIVKKFADPEIYPSSENPISIFMAGSPGAGKTEVLKQVIKYSDVPIVRVDADEVRKCLPQYNGSNSAIVHGAASLGVEKILDSCFKYRQSFILDGLLADYKRAAKNIDRCLSKKMAIIILYVYQNPLLAWEFTQRRETKEGRNIPKHAFIKGFIESRIVVNKLKKKYKDKIIVKVLEKDFDTNDKKYWKDVESIDNCIKILYSAEDLERML